MEGSFGDELRGGARVSACVRHGQAGYSTDDADDAVQANIVAAGCVRGVTMHARWCHVRCLVPQCMRDGAAAGSAKKNILNHLAYRVAWRLVVATPLLRRLVGGLVRARRLLDLDRCPPAVPPAHCRMHTAARRGRIAQCGSTSCSAPTSFRHPHGLAAIRAA